MDQEDKAPPLSSRDAILEAAVEEFSERGYDGVRMEHVARRAGYNKALVYRWFGDRETLFREALKRRFSARRNMLDRLPENLADVLKWWSKETLADPLIMRLVLREALEFRGGEPVEAEDRRAYYARQIQMVRAFQASGAIDPAFGPSMLFIALLAVVTLPSSLPQIVQLATGLDPLGEEFSRRWNECLSLLARRLAGEDKDT